LTRPVVWRRSTAAQRRQQRADFKALKNRLAPSAETLQARERDRSGNERHRARQKVKNALKGQRIALFTSNEIPRVTPAELDMLHREAEARFYKLHEAARARAKKFWRAAGNATVRDAIRRRSENL
jgi:hypothetical protein